MKYWAGELLGAVIGFFLSLSGSAIWGAVYQVALCYGDSAYRAVAERIVGGAQFGMLYLGMSLGVMVAGVGAVAGVFTTWVRHRRRQRQEQGQAPPFGLGPQSGRY
jgi:hypothetical protein